MVSIYVTIFFALLCSPVRAALQASMREGIRAGEIQDPETVASSNTAKEMPQEPTCSDKAKVCPNMGQQIIEPGACGLDKSDTKPCASSVHQEQESMMTPHFDSHGNIVLQLHGEKDVVLWPPEHTPWLYAFPSNHSSTRQEEEDDDDDDDDDDISATEAPDDIAKEMSAGHEQREFGIYVAAASRYINARELAKELEDELRMVEASRNLATVWLLQGKLTDALDELLKTQTVTKTASQLHVLGNVRREMGHISSALELYEEARNLNPVLPEVSIDIGETHARLGSFDTAAKHVQEALDNLDQGSLDAARAHALDGFIHLSRGDAKGGFEKLDSARSIQSQVLRPGHPDLVLTQMHLARALRDMGNFDAALAAAESLEKTLRDSMFEELQLSRALTQKATFLQELDRLTDAEEAMKEAFMLQTQTLGGKALPEVAESLNIYGSILHDKGDIRGARYYYEQALAMNLATVGERHPETAAVHSNLGTLFKDKGKLAKADHHFKASLEIQIRLFGESESSPDIASTLNNMAMVDFQRGRHAEAEMYVEKALSMLDAAQVPEDNPARVAYAANLRDMKKLRAE